MMPTDHRKVSVGGAANLLASASPLEIAGCPVITSALVIEDLRP